MEIKQLGMSRYVGNKIFVSFVQRYVLNTKCGASRMTITTDEEKSEIKEAQCFDCAASSGEIYSFNFNFEKSLNTSNKNIHLRSEK